MQPLDRWFAAKPLWHLLGIEELLVSAVDLHRPAVLSGEARRIEPLAAPSVRRRMERALINWLRASLDAVRTSLWAIPTVMFLLGAALAIFMLQLGSAWPEAGAAWPEWIRAGSGEDARNLLSTLLTSVISLAGIVFSITVVSLSLAANSYGPRLIRTFRSSRSTQLVMGILTMTIVYLLLVLRSVRGQADAAQVPEAAVALGSVLALVSVLGLLAFIQGVATLVVADEVARRVRKEFDSIVDSLPTLEDRGDQPKLPADFAERAGRIGLPREGYVQSVEYSELLRWAEEKGASPAGLPPGRFRRRGRSQGAGLSGA